MFEYYTENTRFYVAVDNIIFSYEDQKLEVLIQERNFEPFNGEQSLMGGFVQTDETVEQAARRIIYDRTGLQDVYLSEVGTFGSLDRDTAARVVSVCYFTIVNRNECDDTRNHEHHGTWIDVHEVPHLIFDHNEMLSRAVLQLRRKITFSPIAVRLLNPSFTLSQLQRLYEVILDTTLDKRNFRKRVAEMPFIEETGEIDKKTSKRGARLFRFNQQLFDEYKNNNQKFKL